MATLETRYRCGPIDISVGDRTLLVSGVPVHLRPKTFDLLLFLIERRARLVSKEELLKYIWSDALVNDNSPARCVIELRRALGDDTRSPQYIRTVPKVGYQFIGALEEDEPATPPPPPTLPRIRRSPWLVAASALLLSAIALGAFLTTRSRVPADDPLSRTVLVLPFENQSQTADLNWLRHALADLIVTNLAQSSRLSIVSASQSVVQATSPRLDEALSMARRLHAGAVIAGGFARFGDSIRVNAKLYDSKDGRLLYAESLDAASPEQILSQADALASELAHDLGGKPSPRRLDNASLPTTRNLKAYRLYSLGLQNANAYHTAQALDQFHQALALDPGFVMAQARIGYTLAVTTGAPEDGRPYLEKAFQQSQALSQADRLHIEAWYAIANHDFPLAIRRYRELLAKDPGETETYVRLGRLLQGEERFPEAIEILKQGLASDPDSTDLNNYLGQLYSLTGRHADAIAIEKRYVALAPEEANSHDSLGLAYAWAGRMAESEQSFARALQIRPDFDLAVRHLATLEAHTGRYRSAAARLRAPFEHSINPIAEAWAGVLLTEFLLSSGGVEEARKVALTVQQKEPGITLPLAWVALAFHNTAQASAIANHVTGDSWTNRGGRSPSQRSTLVTLADIAMVEGRSADAIATYRGALRHSVSWNYLVSHEDCLADAYLKLGRTDEAIAEYQRVLGLFPGMGLAHYHLAGAYLQKGLTAQAADEYRRFLDLWNQADSTVPEVREAKRFEEHLKHS